MNTRSVSTFQFNFRTPGQAMQGPIRFAVGPSLWGKVLVGRSQRGICAIFLGDDAQGLSEQLAAAFPHNELRPDPELLQRELQQTIAFVDGAPPRTLPKA